MKRLVRGACTGCGITSRATPYSAPTFPQEEKPTEPPPPDTEAPPPGQLSNSDIQRQIQKMLSAEPMLANSEVNAAVDDKSVVLVGTVENEQQHDLALRIAKSYASNRRIVDKIQARQKA